MNRPAESSQRDRKVNEIISAYREAEAAGRSPDRATLLARYPDLAAELTRYFANHDAMREMGKPTETIAGAGGPQLGAAEAATIVPTQSPQAGPIAPLRSFGDYQLLDEIARGGMGVVYRARQIRLHRLVALKMILAGQLASPEEVQRFQREAEAIASLDHPGIVPIYEVGEHDGLHYFSMKLIEGGSLASRKLPMPARRAAETLTSVARAVHHAHQRGILHRDLKPGNILLDRQGHPLVTDFGLARQVEGDTHATRTGGIVGTPSYMPPEQARSEKVLTTSVDVYSLGAILYELLTGRPPFRAETPLDTILQVLDCEPQPPRKLRPQMDSDLETICLKCLEKMPERRYSSAAALADELDRWIHGEPILARPVGGAERLWRWGRRNPGIAVSLAALFLTLLIGILVSVSLAVVASTNARVADANAQRADREAASAREEKALSERRRYAAEMKLASLEWEAAQTPLVLQRLDQFVPKQVGEDMRAFDWHYLKRQTELDFRCIPIENGIWGGAGPSLVPGPLTSPVFSPDGRRVVLAEPSVVWGWDTATGRQVIFQIIPNVAIRTVALGPDGRAVAAAGGGDPRIRVLEEAGRIPRLLTGHQGSVTGLSYSPDGKRIYSSSLDRTVRVWDAARGQTIHIFNEHKCPVTRLALSADGRVLACAASDGKVKLWNPDTFVQIHELDHTSAVQSLAFSKDTPLLATAGGGQTIRVWDVTTGKEVCALQVKTGEVQSVAFSPDGLRLASANFDYGIRIWDLPSRKEMAMLRGHTTRVTGIAYSPDGQHLASVGEDRLLRIWDIVAAQQTRTLGSPAQPEDSARGRVAFSPDGLLAAFGTGSGFVKICDATTGQEKLTLRQHKREITSVAFSTDGLLLASASSDGTVKLWDAATGKEVAVLNHSERVRDVAFAADSRQLAAAAGSMVYIWDVHNGQKIGSLPGPGGQLTAVAFSPTDGHLAAKSSEGAIMLWEDASQQGGVLGGRTNPSRDRENSFDDVRAIAFSSDGKQIAGALNDDIIRIWDVRTRQQLHFLQGHQGVVCDMAFSPDGRTLASASFDGTVKVWDATTGQETLMLRGHSGRVSSVTFSPDSRRLISLGQDHLGHDEIKLWDATPLVKKVRLQRAPRSILP
jgi:WD40 repeat protein